MRFGLIGYGLWGRHHATRDPQGARRDARRHRLPERGDGGGRARATSRTCRCTVTTGSSWRAPTWTWSTSWSPTHLHEEIGVAALDAGKDVLLEKPMAADRRAVRPAPRGGPARRAASSRIGHELRLSTQWGAVKAIIDAGDIGEPMYAVMTLFRFPYRPGAERLASRPGAGRLVDPRGAGARLRFPAVVPRGTRRPPVGRGARQRPAAGARHGGQLHRAPAIPGRAPTRSSRRP